MAKKTSMDAIVPIGGGVLAVVLVSYLFVSYTYFNAPPVGCMADYTTVATFDLQSDDGLPLSMIDLQARAGHGEEGLMHNASIVNLDNGPARSALEVKLASADGNDTVSGNGIHFAWRPLGITNAQSACLRYSVFLPEDFDYGSGGNLPGIFGGRMPERTSLADDKSFAVRLRWRKDGFSNVVALAKDVNDNGSAVLNRSDSMPLPRGRWVTFEEQVVLNAPDQKNGEVRVWLNGVKVAEHKKLVLRADEALNIGGVAATVGFGGEAREVASGRAGSLRITPIEFGWR